LRALDLTGEHRLLTHVHEYEEIVIDEDISTIGLLEGRPSIE
jgi:hypothetical protein